MIPFITSETASRQSVGELGFGIDIFDLDLWVQVDSIKQPDQRNSVSSGHVSSWIASHVSSLSLEILFSFFHFLSSCLSFYQLVLCVSVSFPLSFTFSPFFFPGWRKVCQPCGAHECTARDPPCRRKNRTEEDRALTTREEKAGRTHGRPWG